MRDSWLDKYHHRSTRKEGTKDPFDVFIELGETPDVSFDENDAWKKVSSRLAFSDPSVKIQSNRPYFSVIYKVAAVVSLVAVSLFIYLSVIDSGTRQITVTAQNHSINHELPDGSLVYLDANSSITYAAGFEPRIIAFKGIGYYDVVNDDSPFTIKMDNLKVEVLGTIFTLEALPGQFQAFVEEGKVQVSSDTETYGINPGELLTYQLKENKFTLTENNDPNILSWKTGEFVFRNTSLIEVLNQLERYYKVDFQPSANLKNCTVTAEFNQQNLSDVLEVLGEILEIGFTISGSNVKILGKGCH